MTEDKDALERWFAAVEEDINSRSSNETDMKDRDNRPTEEDSDFYATNKDAGEDPHIDSSWLDPIQDEAEKISITREKEERLESLRQKEEGLRRNFSNQEEIDTESDVYKEWEETFDQIQRLEHDEIQEDESDRLSSQQKEEQERLTERMRNLVDRTNEESSSTSESGGDYEKWKQEKISNSDAHDKAERDRNERLTQVQSILTRIDNGTISDADGTLRSKYEAMSRDLGGKVEDRDSSREENSPASPSAEVSYATENNPEIDRLMKEIEQTPAEDGYGATTEPTPIVDIESKDPVYEAKANAQKMIEAAKKDGDLGQLVNDLERVADRSTGEQAQVYRDVAAMLAYHNDRDQHPNEEGNFELRRDIQERGNADWVTQEVFEDIVYEDVEDESSEKTELQKAEEEMESARVISAQASANYYKLPVEEQTEENYKNLTDEAQADYQAAKKRVESLSRGDTPQNEETQPNRRVEGSDADNPLFSNAVNSGFISSEELDNVNPLIRDVARRAGSPRFNNPREYWGTANDRISDRIFELESKGDLTEAEQSELRDLNEYLGRIWGIMENMPVEAQPQQVVGGGFSAQAEGNLDQMARLQSQGLEDEKKQARKEAEIAYQNFLRSERHPNSPLKLIDPDSTADLPVFFSGNEKLGIEGLSVQEQKEHRARRELVNIVYAKRGAVTLEDFSNIAEYAGLRNNELDALEDVPGMVLARREYIRIVQASTDTENNDAQITYFGDDGNEHQIRWNEVQTTEQLELFRNEIKNSIRNEMGGLPRIQQKLRGIDDPIQQAQLVDRYAQEAEQVAFNMLYATNFFEAYQTHWVGNKRDFTSRNKSYAVSSMIYGSMFPVDRLVKESLTTSFKRNSEQVTNLAHANFVREAERKGYDLDEVSKNIGTITILPNKGTGIRGRGEPNFWSISEHDGRYDITVYSPFFDTRVMKDFWDDSRALRIKQKPLDIASRGERINWTRDAEEGAFNSLTITARNLNAYETIMRSNEMIKGISIKGGPDVPEWINKAMDAATKVGKSGDEETLRGLLYSSAILDTNKRAPVITKPRKMETQWGLKRNKFLLGDDPGYAWDIDGWSGKFRWI